jgi:hypothetical protein
MMAVQVTTSLLTEERKNLRLAEDVARALRATGYSSLHDLEVIDRAGLVILGGRVPSNYLKWADEKLNWTLLIPPSFAARF